MQMRLYNLLFQYITDNNKTLDKVIKNKLVSNVTCMNCNYVSSTKQPLYIINLKIDNEINDNLSIEYLLENYQIKNDLFGNNQLVAKNVIN